MDRGHQVITLDNDRRFEPDVCEDILAWNERSVPKPDVVLASPPCEGFTVMNIGRNWTGPTDVPADQPKTETARMGLRLVERTLEVIAELTPAFWVVENPRAKLRKLPIVKPYEMRTVTYCQYGLTTMKPTDLWGGFPPSLELKPPCRNGDPCHVRAPRGSRSAGSIQGLADRAKRARIPYQLALAFCLAAERDLIGAK
jgi:hypothetical protein